MKWFLRSKLRGFGPAEIKIDGNREALSNFVREGDSDANFSEAKETCLRKTERDGAIQSIPEFPLKNAHYI